MYNKDVKPAVSTLYLDGFLVEDRFQVATCRE
jgi:hypothetical protein